MEPLDRAPIATFGPFLALLAACAFFASQTDRFLTGQNFSLILQQVMVVGVMAIGQTVIILTAGIDLSCGMVMALGSIVMSKLAVDAAMNPYLAIACGLLACGAFGLLNGALITYARLPPFIVTLGTLNIAFAITQIHSESQTVSGLPDALLFFGTTFSIGRTAVTYGTVLMLGMISRRGSCCARPRRGGISTRSATNAEAARLMGIPARRLLVSVYTMAALIYGIAALLAVARTGVGDPQAGQTDNLDSITAVVLGGTSLFGGRGMILGTLIGALIVGGVPQRTDTDGRPVGLSNPDHRNPGYPGCHDRPAVPPEDVGACPRRLLPWSWKRAGLSAIRHVTALDGADFELPPGEILAVIGDNGAGKSTLIKALSGALVPDEGEMFLDGKPVRFHTPIDARRQGIETVYQDLAVAPAMTIAENLFLGRELHKPGVLGWLLRLLDKKKMSAEAAAHMKDLQIGIGSMTQAVETLSGGQRQGVAVARGAAFARHVVIMDEPTAALGVKESNMVLDLIRRVRYRACR